MKFTSLAVCFISILFAASTNAADRVIIGNVSRTVEQLPNYAATDKGFFTQQGIQGDVVLIGSTDTLIQALIAGQVNVAIVDPSAAINAVERAGFQRLIDLMGDRLFKSKPYPAPEKYLDMSYLRRAQQEMGITPGR